MRIYIVHMQFELKRINKSLNYTLQFPNHLRKNTLSFPARYPECLPFPCHQSMTTHLKTLPVY